MPAHTSSHEVIHGFLSLPASLTGGLPYHDTANSDIGGSADVQDQRPCQRPQNCSEEIYGIMLKCCAAFPGDRPSFSTLHHVFRSLHTTANDGQYITLNIVPTERFAAQSTEIAHFHSASYSYSDAGGLPCITEEGEDVDNEDEEEREEEGDKRDSSNDSTYSHDSVKFRKLSDKEDSEESLIAAGVTTIEFV
ncbi:hypothetical protein GBAR_LOCUS8975 [Geodia barretti]|uniref:Serine-threonine/tyrosine-protein kinase catalytic domain-containing protein n=1 Tax=Geodia barretti TaxID=519541 RepID=A0AA35RMR9_GEOBA|nr:hypothetical protein GBAR_LOCUS8975 [Geodia barretti]